MRTCYSICVIVIFSSGNLVCDDHVWIISENSLANTSLDRFLAKNTSEDNTSFVQIMDEAEKKRRVKNAWLFDKEGEQLAVRFTVCTINIRTYLSMR